MRIPSFHDDRGAAAVEFGLLAPVLVAFLLPMYDIGAGTYEKMRVQDAAEAGAQYALEHGYNSTSIASAAQNATSLGANVTVSSSEACYCANASGVLVATPSPAAPPPCTSTCSDGSTPGTFVQVTTSYTYTTLLNYPSVPSSFSLSGTAMVRIS